MKSASRLAISKSLQEERLHNCRGDLCLFFNETHKARRQENMWSIYNRSYNPDKNETWKCDENTARKTLGYRSRNSYMVVARGAAKREKDKRRNK